MPRIRNLLCPVDLSTASLRAFDYSLQLAKSYDASVHLLHVIAPVISTAYEFYVDTGKVLATIQKHAQSEIKKLVKVAAGAGVKADSEVRTGAIEKEILDAVKRRRADMIVVGKHGRGGIERWFVGSVTDHLLRRVSVPMLIISEGKTKRASPPNIKRILITTDLSDGTHEAIEYALSLAKERQAGVTLLHVVPTTVVGMSQPFETTLAEARAELEQLIPEKVRTGGRVTTKIESGIPYQEIVNFAKANKPDVIVMNIHGKGVFDRFLLGSNAERVIRGVSCPVLVIPPRRRRPKAGVHE